MTGWGDVWVMMVLIRWVRARNNCGHRVQHSRTAYPTVRLRRRQNRLLFPRAIAW